MIKTIRRDEYFQKIRIQRASEQERLKNTEHIKTSSKLSSPSSSVPSEETRLLKEYIERKNTILIGEADHARRKTLNLKSFFRMKRNQQVEVMINGRGETDSIVGKVSAIGRDFVMITNLRFRTWIPYSTIKSANIPFGIPNYSNVHQHFIYDNDLQRKLVLNFGDTVSRKEDLLQLFCEDTLQTNLNSWRRTLVEVRTTENIVISGKIVDVHSQVLYLLSALGKERCIALENIAQVSTIRWLQVFKRAIHLFFKSRRRADATKPRRKSKSTS